MSLGTWSVALGSGAILWMGIGWLAGWPPGALGLGLLSLMGVLLAATTVTVGISWSQLPRPKGRSLQVPAQEQTPRAAG